MEQVIHELIQDTKKVNFKKFGAETMLLCKGLKPINLYELVRKVNFTQLALNSLDLNTYAYNKILHGEDISYYDLTNQIKNHDTNHHTISGLSKLHYAELIALRKYSDEESCKLMNKFLRSTNDVDINKLPSILLHCAIASNGLNKLSDTHIEQIVVRREDTYQLQELTLAAEFKQVLTQHSLLVLHIKTHTL